MCRLDVRMVRVSFFERGIRFFLYGKFQEQKQEQGEQVCDEPKHVEQISADQRINRVVIFVAIQRKEKEGEIERKGGQNTAFQRKRFAKEAGGELQRHAGKKEQNDGEQIDEEKVYPSDHGKRGKILCDFGKGIMFSRRNGGIDSEKNGEKQQRAKRADSVADHDFGRIALFGAEVKE